MIQIIRKLFKYSLIIIPYISPAQESGITDHLSNYVDPFTGDFSYSVPLLTVTGKNGESVPVTVRYHGGIAVNEEASWVGLGWNYEPGEVRRTVNGVPDDWRNKVVVEQRTARVGIQVQTNKKNKYYHGPIYFNKFYSDHLSAGHNINEGFDYLTIGNPPELSEYCMDIYQSTRHNEFFEFPDYDKYYVSGPGIGGEISPGLFDYANLYHRNQEYHSCGYTKDRFVQFTKKPIFYFVEEPVAYNNTPFYSDGTFVNMRTCYKEPLSCRSCIDLSFRDPYKLKEDNSDYCDMIHTSEGRRIKSGNIIEYFTNEEINSYDPSVADNLLKTKGFLDYRIVSGERRPAPEYDPDGIGAFVITNSSGYIFNYSLPVYNSQEVTNKVTLDENGALSDKEGELRSDIFRNDLYASSWKLTSVTGPDYIDVNQNGIVDYGDSGFWIAYEYELWSDNFIWKNPFNDDTYLRDFLYRNENRYSYGCTQCKNYVYDYSGSRLSGLSQIFYLKSIKTNTQTAYFFKEIRNDAVGRSMIGSTPIYTPKARLKYIALFDNKDLQSNNPFNASQNVTSSDFTDLNGTEKKLLSGYQYENLSADMKNKALKTVQFSYDYHLAYNLDNNIQKINGHSSNTGKLSLNEITILDKAASHILPPYIFTYGYNPEFKFDKKDYFGYYKKDYDNSDSYGFLTNNDKDFSKAWSLTQITEPIGNVINVEYEPDTYEKVSYDSKSYVPERPSRIFIIDRVYKNSGKVIVEANCKAALDLLGDISNTYNKGLKFSHLYTNNSNELDIISETFKNGFNYIKQDDYTFQLTSPLLYDNDPDNIFNMPFGKDGLFFIKIILKEALGGGLRVKRISETDESNNSYGLSYEYSGGLLTTEPDPYYTDFSYCFIVSSNHPGDRHALPPMVGYDKVAITQFAANNECAGTTENTYMNYPEQYNRVITNFVYNSLVNYILIQIKQKEINGFDPTWERQIYSNVNNIILGIIEDSEPLHYTSGIYNDYGSEQVAAPYGDINKKVTDYLIGVAEELKSQLDGATPSSEVQAKLTFLFNLEQQLHSLGLTCSSFSNPDADLSGTSPADVGCTNPPFPNYNSTFDYVLSGQEYLPNNYNLLFQVTEIATNNKKYGLLKTQKKFDCYNNKISETNYDYVDVGHIGEVFYRFSESGCGNILNSNDVYSLTKYSTLLKSIVKTQDNVTTKTVFDDFDSYTGIPLKTTVTSTGTPPIMTEKTLAYNSYPDMGSKLENPANKNMLSAPLTEKIYRNKINLNAGTHSVWSNSNNVRKFDGTRYTTAASQPVKWMPGKTLAYNGQPAPDNWLNTSEITLVDNNNRVLEQKDVNNVYSAVKYGYNDRYKIAEAQNCRYTELAFSGAEDDIIDGNYFGGEVSKCGTIVTSVSHTGDKSLQVAAGGFGFTYTTNVNSDGYDVNKSYKISCWVKESAGNSAFLVADFRDADGNAVYYKAIDKSDPNTVSDGNWHLITLTIPPDAGLTENLSSAITASFYIWNNAGSGNPTYVDDFRFYPADAVVTTYVYDEKTGLVTAALDNENFATIYIYDNAGRLIETKRETLTGIKTVSTNEYHYARE